jgi:hypothetical protein
MFGWLGKFSIDKFDELWASMSRPYLNYVLGTSIAAACLHHDTAPIAIPSAAALLGGNVVVRTVEKVKGAVTSNSTNTSGGPQ